MSDSKEAQLNVLKTHFGITPKTANLLYAAGYNTPPTLAESTPNEIVQAFARLPGMDEKKAKDYARPARRMCMLGAITDSDQAAAAIRDCKV